MAAHAVCGSGIEAVVAKEAAGRIGGQHLSVKEHRDHICVLGTKLHIVRYHHDGDTLIFQLAQNICQLFLKEASIPLVGSSSRSSLGLVSSTFAKAERRCSPPGRS